MRTAQGRTGRLQCRRQPRPAREFGKQSHRPMIRRIYAAPASCAPVRTFRGGLSRQISDGGARCAAAAVRAGSAHDLPANRTQMTRPFHTRPVLARFDHARLAPIVALTGAGLALGGLWTVLLGFAALCTAADTLVSLPSAAPAGGARGFGLLVRQRRRGHPTGKTGQRDVREDAPPWARSARRQDLGLCSIPIDSPKGTVERLKA